jgi:toxin ParE1/3/4
VQRLEASFHRLIEQPYSGPPRDRLAPGLRVLNVRGYAVYYAVTEADVLVVRVVHGARDVAALFRQ